RYPDGRKTAQVLQWAGNDGPSGAKYYSYSESSGESPVKVWYDASGKELRSEAYGLNKRKIWVDTKYDSKNRVIEVSKPYFPEETKTFAAKYSYDNYGRTDTIVTPMGTTIYTYIGLTTRVSTPEGTEESTVNNAGWTVSQKTNNKEVRFTHYANGQVKTATPMGTGNVPLPSIRMEYDLQGNRTKIIDPDAGTITTAFDAWGQLVQEKQYVHYQEKPTIISPLSDRLNPGGGTIIGPPIITDPVEQIPLKVMVTTSYEYYPSGLMKKKTRNGENTLYEYDNYHRLKRINIGLKHSMGFTYDNYDRITTVRDTVDNNKIFVRNTGYDALGRVSKETYPGGFWVSNQYDTYGNLLSVNSMHGHKLWEAEDANAQGQITKSKTGNKQTVYIYNAKNMLESIKSDGIIDLTYEYKSDGNMGKRRDKINTVGDEFAYDPLKRLSKWYVGKSVSSPSVYSISYDPTTGNITDKYLAGYNMQYGENNKPPHALTSMRSESDDYFPIQSIKYTDFKKVKEISQNGNKLTLQYGVDEQRVKTVYTPAVGSSLTRYYMGNYEEEIRGTSTRKINYINGGNGLAAIYIQNNGKDSIYYAHTDFQGNLIALCKENGTVAEHYAYDPWGRRVNPSDWREEDTRTGYIVNRGYTMHEHLDQFGLINMNGRVYDPRLGMFLSPDPYVQAPGNWLNYNRYSYCLNNPLRYTDPDGESFVLIAAIIVGAYLGGSSVNGTFNPGKWDYNNWQTYAGIAVGGVAGYAGAAVGAGIAAASVAGGASSIGAGVAGGLMGGVMSGGINGAGMTAINGGNFHDIMSNMTKGMVIGGFGGALSGGVGSAIGDFSGVAGNAFKNGMYELGHSAIKGAATGLAGGTMMAAMEQDASYLWKGAAMGAAFSAGMAGLRIGLMGSAIIPPGSRERFAADDAAFGIKNDYPVYRRGGIMRYFTPGITLGRNMMVDTRYLNSSNPKWRAFYYETLAHERAHIYQQKIMGSFNFYKRTLYEYLINPGYLNDPYNNPNCLEYWADQYMKLTP
ncbi:hypothetical protein LJC06_04320, partial [Bacteroidales bacterium OttesenSCG-928-I14]|nr:hypothetical protein [Bacteroidales bacterium OttesenSCG-928-I14]